METPASASATGVREPERAIPSLGAAAKLADWGEVRVPGDPISGFRSVYRYEARAHVVEIRSRFLAIEGNGTKKRVPFFRSERLRRESVSRRPSELHFEKPKRSVRIPGYYVDFGGPGRPIPFDDRISRPFEMPASDVFPLASYSGSEVFRRFSHKMRWLWA